MASELPLAPVSLVVAPHLERIYAEMGRRCIGREGDPHRWVKPEFHGKRFGEASLPFEQSLSRLYIYHYDPLESGKQATVSEEEREHVKGYLHRSWGATRIPPTDLQAEPGTT